MRTDVTVSVGVDRAELDEALAVATELEAKLRAIHDLAPDLNVRRLALQPGDTVVLETDGSSVDADKFETMWNGRFHGHPCVVLGGMRVSAVIPYDHERPDTTGDAPPILDQDGCARCGRP